MKELIKIKEENGRKLVSAKELYIGLGMNKSQWSRWYKKNIINNPIFKENISWRALEIEIYGNKTLDFYISLDFTTYLINSAKTCDAESKVSILKLLGLYNKKDIISKYEIEFGNTLKRFFNELNVTIESQFHILNYNIDFLVAGFVAIEYDEEHHQHELEEDIKRMNDIDEYIEDISNGDFALSWVRVEKGKEIEGLAKIMDILIADETISSWDNKTKVYNFDIREYLNMNR